MIQKYCIADLKIEMDTFGKTLSQAEPYRCEYDGLADGIIRAPRQTDSFPRISEDDFEYMYTGFMFSELLLRLGGMVLHSSAVAVNGKGYCFSANSGVGKSTHARLYSQHFGEDQVRVINDDKPALRCCDGIWHVYGTPWSGKTAMNTNMHVPLAGICFLEQGERNSIVRLSTGDALKHFWPQNPFPKDAILRYGWMVRLDSILKNIPIWKMTCNMSPEAAAVSYAAMSGKEG